MSARLSLIAGLFLLNTACTAAKATYTIVLAEQSVDRAAEYGAPELAVYEYTMAVRYLEKSREEAGYADYRVSVELAEKSAEWADKSIIAIDSRGTRGQLEVDLNDVPEAAPAAAPADDLPALDVIDE